MGNYFKIISGSREPACVGVITDPVLIQACDDSTGGFKCIDETPNGYNVYIVDRDNYSGDETIATIDKWLLENFIKNID
jgi:hypothetical protein